MTNDENKYGDVMPWEQGAEASVREDAETMRVYDLEERTAKFGEAVIDFLKRVPEGPRTTRLIDPLTECGTSVGGNYCEADDAISKKDFVKIIGTCRKEAREAKFFLRMLARSCPTLKAEARTLWIEANELHPIFSKIRRTALANLAKAG